jgi:ribonuclease HI
MFIIEENLLKNINGIALENKNNFEKSIYEVIKDKHGMVVLNFPCSLSVAERHSIHRFSQKGICEALSWGEHPNRYIQVHLSSKYVKQIQENYKNENYKNENENKDKDNLNKIKKAMIDDLIEIIDKYLQEMYDIN